MRLIKIILCLLIFYPAACITAQEVVVPLGSNDILLNEWVKNRSHSTQNLHSAAVNDTLSLPFIDDFSGALIYPDTRFWMDSCVYVNRDMPIGPVTVGVATFDGAGKTGVPYDTVTSNSNISLPADTLTSRPIYLQSIAPGDTSVYLSFYYQARGRGDKPDIDDSLLLEFHRPLDTVWKKVWGRAGYSSSQQPDTTFRLVMLRVDSSYFKRGFQFRFRNKATPSGYVDQWNIDYVYLKNNRSASDTLFRDVAFVYTPSSLLKKYQAMPYYQYQASEMTDSLNNYIRNNDTVYVNTSYFYDVKDASSSVVYTSPSGSGNIESIFNYSYTICTVPSTGCRTLLRPPLGYTFPDPLTGSTYYTVEHFIAPGTDFITRNDTLTRKQVFANFYAYDDGTAELAYGLSWSGAQLAYRFTLNKPDSLRGLDMYFNWMPNGNTNSVTQRQFRITVWNDAGGVPGSIVYQDSIVTPNYQYEFHNDWGNLTNVFYRYPLTRPKYLTGTFYVGWVQYGPDLLNIGLDRNTNSDNNMFFNVGNGWQNSIIPGSWMIRPLFGSTAEMQGVPEHKQETSDLALYPNPAQDILYIRTSPLNYDRMKILIMDAFGRVVMNERSLTSESIDISSLSSGIYLVRITSEDGCPVTRKLIISR